VRKKGKQLSSGCSKQDGRRNKTRTEMKQRNKNDKKKRTEAIVLRSGTGNGRGTHGSGPDTVLLHLLV